MKTKALITPMQIVDFPMRRLRYDNYYHYFEFKCLCFFISSPEPKVQRPASVSRPQFQRFFFETAWPMKAKFCVEHPWVNGTKICSRDHDHMTKMATTPIYG